MLQALVSGPRYPQDMKLKGKDWVWVFLILVGGWAVNNWGLSWIPFHKLPVSQFWWVIIARSASALLSLLAIRIFCPHVLPRFGLGKRPKQLLISLGVILFVMGPNLWHTDYRSAGLAQIFESFVFALFIGIDEDFFSRGFIFGGLQRYGIWFAAIVSSIHFGLLHLGNILWGGQSAAYTIAQAVSAGAFGFLAAALMIYSGTIWVPILMHGLCDFPMQFETSFQYTKIVTGGGNWVSVAADFIVFSTIGCVLIGLSDPVKKEKLLVLGQKFGLVDAK